MDGKIKRAVSEYGMLSRGDRVAVGFSGGADSAALLYHLHSHREEYGISLSAVHVHHMIRGAEADRDMEFCKRFCEKLGIPLVCEKINVPELAKERGTGLEETGRDERYRVYASLLSGGTDKIALAHHADDNLETVLFDLIRGSGPRGIRGIPPVRDRYIRPLIYCAKDEIIAYCRENGIDFITDSTNAENDCSRNLIRNKVVPVLKEINPSAPEAVLRSGRLIRADEEYFEKLVSEIPGNASRKYLAGLPDPLLSRYIIRTIRDAAGVDPEAVHTEECMRLVRAGNGYKESSLPGGCTAVCDRNAFFLRKNGGDTPKVPANDPIFIKIQPGITEYSLDNHTCRVIISYEEEDIISAAEKYGVSESGKTVIDRYRGDLYLRTRRPGDVVRSHGMTKRLKELLRSGDIPCSLRNSLPLLCDGCGILWIPGILRADRPEGDKKEKKIFAILIIN